jgi:hypothetical protein
MGGEEVSRTLHALSKKRVYSAQCVNSALTVVPRLAMRRTHRTTRTIHPKVSF